MFGNAVQEAAARDNPRAMKLHLDHGATVDSPGLEWENLVEKLRGYGDTSGR